jgi:hypothetical protein
MKMVLPEAQPWRYNFRVCSAASPSGPEQRIIDAIASQKSIGILEPEPEQTAVVSGSFGIYLMSTARRGHLQNSEEFEAFLTPDMEKARAGKRRMSQCPASA